MGKAGAPGNDCQENKKICFYIPLTIIPLTMNFSAGGLTLWRFAVESLS